MTIDNFTWTGESGREYPFEIHDKTTKFNEVDGNYIFAKKTLSGWDAIYIGEGDLKTRTQDPEHLKCAIMKGFSHYHVHSNSDENARLKEEEDLIQGNKECLVENGGCNKTAHG